MPHVAPTAPIIPQLPPLCHPITLYPCLPFPSFICQITPRFNPPPPWFSLPILSYPSTHVKAPPTPPHCIQIYINVWGGGGYTLLVGVFPFPSPFRNCAIYEMVSAVQGDNVGADCGVAYKKSVWRAPSLVTRPLDWTLGCGRPADIWTGACTSNRCCGKFKIGQREKMSRRSSGGWNWSTPKVIVYFRVWEGPPYSLYQILPGNIDFCPFQDRGVFRKVAWRCWPYIVRIVVDQRSSNCTRSWTSHRSHNPARCRQVRGHTFNKTTGLLFVCVCQIGIYKLY